MKVQRDSINYFPPWVNGVNRLGFFADLDSGVGSRKPSCRQGSRIEGVERRLLAGQKTDEREMSSRDRGRFDRRPRRWCYVDVGVRLGVRVEGNDGIVDGRVDDGRPA